MKIKKTEKGKEKTQAVFHEKLSPAGCNVTILERGEIKLVFLLHAQIQTPDNIFFSRK